MRDLFPAGVMLADDVVVLQDNGALKFISEKSFEFRPVLESDFVLIRDLKAGIDGETLQSLWGASSRTRAILSTLYHKQNLRPFSHIRSQSSPELKRQQSWLHQFSSQADFVQKQISELTVGIVGCGGTGTVIVEHLVAMGVKRYVLIDFDTVEKNNFNRQFSYRRMDIGRPKPEALRDYILQRSPNAHVVIEMKKIDESEFLGTIIREQHITDIFACADQPAGTISSWIALAASQVDCSCIFGSVGLVEGTVGPLLIATDPKKKFAEAMKKVGVLAEKAFFPVTLKASLAPVNTIIAATMVMDWWLWRTRTGKPLSLHCSTEWDAKANHRKVLERWDA